MQKDFARRVASRAAKVFTDNFGTALEEASADIVLLTDEGGSVRVVLRVLGQLLYGCVVIVFCVGPRSLCAPFHSSCSPAHMCPLCPFHFTVVLTLTITFAFRQPPEGAAARVLARFEGFRERAIAMAKFQKASVSVPPESRDGAGDVSSGASRTVSGDMTRL
jgi:hypothetical protein